MSQLNNIGLHQ